MNAVNPMNIRTRSSRAVSRRSMTPQYTPTSGTTYAATPNEAVRPVVSQPPTVPAPSNHSPRIDRSPSTTSPIPSRVPGVRGEDLPHRRLLGHLLPARGPLRGGSAGGFRVVLRDPARPEERDDERRDGEVFVAMGAQV